MFTVLQRYRVRLGTVADAATRAEESLVPRLKDVTGFVSYHFLHTGDSTVAAMALFETRSAADAAARLLSDWFRSDWPAFRLLAPDLSVAESLTLTHANGDSAAAQLGQNGSYDVVPEEVMEAEPQPSRDRRKMGDRRVLVEARFPERRSGVERRTVLERRGGSERRGIVAPTETVAMSERRNRIAPAWRRREASHSR
jgi:hypothetical protein